MAENWLTRLLRQPETAVAALATDLTLPSGNFMVAFHHKICTDLRLRSNGSPTAESIVYQLGEGPAIQGAHLRQFSAGRARSVEAMIRKQALPSGFDDLDMNGAPPALTAFLFDNPYRIHDGLTIAVPVGRELAPQYQTCLRKRFETGAVNKGVTALFPDEPPSNSGVAKVTIKATSTVEIASLMGFNPVMAHGGLPGVP